MKYNKGDTVCFIRNGLLVIGVILEVYSDLRRLYTIKCGPTLYHVLETGIFPPRIETITVPEITISNGLLSFGSLHSIEAYNEDTRLEVFTRRKESSVFNKLQEMLYGKPRTVGRGLQEFA